MNATLTPHLGPQAMGSEEKEPQRFFLFELLVSHV